MSIADPLVIAAAAPTPALNFAVVDRSKPFQSDRQDAGGVYTNTFSHQLARSGAKRHYIKVSNTKIATSPITALDSKQVASVSVSISVPPFGFTDVEITALYELIDDAVRAATLPKILNMES
jgi:hypothetical protein